MKFGTCNEYFQDWPLEQVFDYAAAIGYDGVEIAPFTIAPSVEEIGTGRRRIGTSAHESDAINHPARRRTEKTNDCTNGSGYCFGECEKGRGRPCGEKEKTRHPSGHPGC